MRKLLKITATFALALVFTAGMAFGQPDEGAGGDITLDQYGDRNDATIQQVGLNNQSVGLQDGNRNLINTLVRNKDYTTRQEQVGDRNEATIQTTDGGNGGTIVQEQFGDLNDAQVGGEFGQQFAKQVQDGNRNEAVITGKMRRGSEARQFQYGDRNRTYLGVSFAKTSTAYQYQDGNRNRSIVRDFSGQSPANGGDSEVYTEQIGDRNLVESEWGSYVNNNLSATQVGDLNEVQSTFGGPNNIQDVTQNGNRNTAVLNQSDTVVQQ